MAGNSQWRSWKAHLYELTQKVDDCNYRFYCNAWTNAVIHLDCSPEPILPFTMPTRGRDPLARITLFHELKNARNFRRKNNLIISCRQYRFEEKNAVLKQESISP